MFLFATDSVILKGIERLKRKMSQRNKGGKVNKKKQNKTKQNKTKQNKTSQYDNIRNRNRQ